MNIFYLHQYTCYIQRQIQKKYSSNLLLNFKAVPPNAREITHVKCREHVTSFSNSFLTKNSATQYFNKLCTIASLSVFSTVQTSIKRTVVVTSLVFAFIVVLCFANTTTVHDKSLIDTLFATLIDLFNSNFFQIIFFPLSKMYFIIYFNHVTIVFTPITNFS